MLYKSSLFFYNEFSSRYYERMITIRGILDLIEDITEEIQWELEGTVEESKYTTTDIVDALSEFPEIADIWERAIKESIESLMLI